MREFIICQRRGCKKFWNRWGLAILPQKRQAHFRGECFSVLHWRVRFCTRQRCLFWTSLPARLTRERREAYVDYCKKYAKTARLSVEHICPYCENIVLCINDYENGYVYNVLSASVLAEAFIVTLINGAIVILLFIWMHRKYGLRG